VVIPLVSSLTPKKRAPDLQLIDSRSPSQRHPRFLAPGNCYQAVCFPDRRNTTHAGRLVSIRPSSCHLNGPRERTLKLLAASPGPTKSAAMTTKSVPSLPAA
jgi:hypothetical protein